MNYKSILTKQNTIVLVVVLLCFLEAVQMVDFSQPLLPSFQYDSKNLFHAFRQGFLCAKTELLQKNVKEFYFLQATTYAQRDLIFESFYAPYILAPEISVTSDSNSPYAITAIEPENVNKFLIEEQNEYTLVKQCGITGILVLKKK